MRSWHRAIKGIHPRTMMGLPLVPIRWNSRASESFFADRNPEDANMKTRFLITTAVGLLFATAAYAQSPSSTTPSATQQTQTPSASPSATQKSPDANTTQAPTSTPPQAQTTAPGGPSTSQPAHAQTNNPAPASGQAQAPGNGTANTSAQQSTSTKDAPQTPSPNNTAQTPSTNNAAQSSAPNNTAPSPSTNAAQSPSGNVNASVNINDQQRTRVSQSISRLNVQPINNVNFSLTVGTAVPRDIHLQTLPADVVEVVPQYRGYSFFVVRDEIVIVEPSTYQIVTVLPRSGGSTAAAPARSQSKVSFTDKDRDVVRKHVKSRPERQATGSAAQTTGSSAKMVIRRGERLPESVEVEEFPETVYREAPALREYRYIHRENRT